MDRPTTVSRPKILDRQQLAQRVAALKDDGHVVVFTNGCFDILHAGHVTYLAEARALGDHLIVAVNSDRSVRSIKGPSRPINPEDQRAAVLAGLETVDSLVLFDEDHVLDLLRELKPQVYVKGGDYRLEDLPEYPLVTGYGGVVRVLSLVAGVSTTNLIERIRALPN